MVWAFKEELNHKADINELNRMTTPGRSHFSPDRMGSGFIPMFTPHHGERSGAPSEGGYDLEGEISENEEEKREGDGASEEQKDGGSSAGGGLHPGAKPPKRARSRPEKKEDGMGSKEQPKEKQSQVVLPKAPEEFNRGTKLISKVSSKEQKIIRELWMKASEMDKQLQALRK